MAVNTTTITLQGNGVAGASITLAGSQAPLAGSLAFDFGAVTVGSSKVQSFTMSNPSAANLTVQTISRDRGRDFLVPSVLQRHVPLASGQTASFQVKFQPLNRSTAQGTLAVDGRSFNLTGLGITPPLEAVLPSLAINLASTAGASAQQNNLSVALGSASPVGGSGTLAMQFTPSVPGVADDPSVQFLSGKARLATVNFAQGSSVGTFNGQSNIAFSTGATAGTISFTLTLEDGTPAGQTTLTIPPAAVTLDTATGLRKAGELDVSLTGLDNSYSASQLSFTFYDAAGATVQPGAIPVNVSSTFQQVLCLDSSRRHVRSYWPISGDRRHFANRERRRPDHELGRHHHGAKIPIAGSTPPQVLPTSY